MEQKETKDYIIHHLSVASITHSIFTDAAINLIFEYSGGIARIVNNVCLGCLLDAALRKAAIIDDHMVKVVLEKEMMI